MEQRKARRAGHTGQCFPFLSAQLEKEFQSARALPGIIAYCVCSVHYMEENLPRSSRRQQIVLPLLLYEYKDQNLVQQLYMIFFFNQLNFQQIQFSLGSYKCCWRR